MTSLLAAGEAGPGAGRPPARPGEDPVRTGTDPEYGWPAFRLRDTPPTPCPRRRSRGGAWTVDASALDSSRSPRRRRRLWATGSARRSSAFRPIPPPSPLPPHRRLKPRPDTEVAGAEAGPATSRRASSSPRHGEMAGTALLLEVLLVVLLGLPEARVVGDLGDDRAPGAALRGEPSEDTLGGHPLPRVANEDRGAVLVAHVRPLAVELGGIVDVEEEGGDQILVAHEGRVVHHLHRLGVAGGVGATSR